MPLTTYRIPVRYKRILITLFALIFFGELFTYIVFHIRTTGLPVMDRILITMFWESFVGLPTVSLLDHYDDKKEKKTTTKVTDKPSV